MTLMPPPTGGSTTSRIPVYRRPGFPWIVGIIVALLGIAIVALSVSQREAKQTGASRTPDSTAVPTTTGARPTTTTSVVPTTTSSTVPSTTTTTLVVIPFDSSAPAAPASGGAPGSTADSCARDLPASEKPVEIKAGCTISGDVRVGRTALRAPEIPTSYAYFDGKGTPAFTHMGQDGWVVAKWGASVSNKPLAEVCDRSKNLCFTWPEHREEDPEYVAPAAPAASATPAAPAASAPDRCGPDLAIEETRVVPVNCRVIGDIEYQDNNGVWIRAYDDDPSTGLVISTSRDRNIYAKYGAGVTSRSLEAVLAEGCGPNCRLTTIDGQTPRSAPVPSAPAVGSTQTTTTVPATPEFIDHCWNNVGKIPAGGSKFVPAGCNVVGDVMIDGYKFHDSKSSTCQITVMRQGGTVHSPAEYKSAADVSSRTPDDLAAANGGCEIKNWPNDKGSGNFENQTD